MRIGEPELSSQDGQVTWAVSVEGLAGTPERLWYRVPEEHGDLVTERADPALIGLVLPAMFEGRSVEVAGPVTDELAFNMKRACQRVLKTMIANLSEVDLVTRNTVRAETPAPGVATGFSGGVDSYAVLVDYHFKPAPPDLRLTHLAFFNVGSHDRGDRGRVRFQERYHALAPFAAELDLPFVPVDSNLDDFYNFSSFPRTQGPRTMSAAFLLQRGIGRYYLASGVPFSELGVRRVKESSNADPITVPLFTTRQFRPIFHGLESTRVEKTLSVAELPISYRSLNVCVFPSANGRNCSKCLKCLRTQLTLEIAGRLDDYREVFDAETYREQRARYQDQVVTARDDVFATEIRAQARATGFPLPPFAVAGVRRGVRLLLRKASSALNRSRRRMSRLRPLNGTTVR